MAEQKRYYWLKLIDSFFDDKKIKKLRRIAGGDTYTLIYLKMQMLSLKTEGKLEYIGLEDEFYKELALDLDETEENVRATLMYLNSCGLIETSDGKIFTIPYVVDNLGSETANAQRIRECRSRKKVSEYSENISNEIDMKYTRNKDEMQVKSDEIKVKYTRNTSEMQMKSDEMQMKSDEMQMKSDEMQVKQKRNVEIEKEKDIEIEKKKNTKKEKIVFPDDEELQNTFDDFVEMRNRIRKPMTDAAIKLTLDRLESISKGDRLMKKAILEQSIQNSYQGVFPLKPEKGKPKETKYTSTDDFWKMVNEEENKC